MSLKLIKPTTDAQLTTHTTTDTLEVTPDVVRSWELPPFQRDLKVTDRLIDIAKEIKANSGVIPGVITLGVLENIRYKVDGQHRLEAFLQSECLVGYCDVRILYFKTMAEMAAEYYRLNSRIVNMKPDDYLKALESENTALAKLRKRCPFIGYGMIRRNDKGPILSMSAVLRGWNLASKDTPSGGGCATTDIAKTLSVDDVDQLGAFLTAAITAWGRDREYMRLWGGLNLTLCMWLYRRLVIEQYSTKTPKLTNEQFGKCLMAVSADSLYLNYLQGRQLSHEHRSPTYNKLKQIFAGRIEVDTGKKPQLPQPSWTSSMRGHR
jgi:hypothetical protein